MRRYNFFISVFEKALKRGDSFVVNRSSDAYNFFSSELPHEFTKNSYGDLLVSTKDNSKKEKRNNILQKIVAFQNSYIDRKVDIGTDLYSYIMCEFRENTPTVDSNGNFLMSDEIVKSKTR